MKIEEKIREYLLEKTKISPAAFIYEDETFKIPSDLDFVVKEWRIDTALSRHTDASKAMMIMLEYDVMQRTSSQTDFITEPAEALMLALQDYADNEVWDVQVETGTAEHARIAIIATFRLIK